MRIQGSAPPRVAEATGLIEKRAISTLIASTFLLSISAFAPAPASAGQKPFTFGLLLVGPSNDRGWSQAHFEAGHYVEKE